MHCHPLSIVRSRYPSQPSFRLLTSLPVTPNRGCGRRDGSSENFKKLFSPCRHVACRGRSRELFRSPVFDGVAPPPSPTGGPRPRPRSENGRHERSQPAAITRFCRKSFLGPRCFRWVNQTKPILSFGGIDRSWASSRDESWRERLRLIVAARGFLGPAHRRQVIAVCDQQTPPFTPETISRRAAPTFRHLAKLISGFLLKPCLQRIARSREQRPPSEVSEQSAHSRPVISALSAGDSRREIRRFRPECCGNFCSVR